MATTNIPTPTTSKPAMLITPRNDNNTANT